MVRCAKIFWVITSLSKVNYLSYTLLEFHELNSGYIMLYSCETGLNANCGALSKTMD